MANRQVRVDGTHIYLVNITPNPFRERYRKLTPSHLSYINLKTKKKTIIRLNKEDLALIVQGQEVKVGSFKLLIPRWEGGGQ